LHGGLKVSSGSKYKKITTLDKVDRKLNGRELLICDDSGAQALGGTMGGLNSEVTNLTKRIALEAAHFNPRRVAETSRIHKLSSEASRRMERGTDPALTSIASARASELLIELAGAKFVGTSFAGTGTKNKVIKISPEGIADLVGFTYSMKQIKDAFIAIGCKVAGTATKLTITIPSWRPDLNTVADLSEEVARFNDYALIPSKLPIGKRGAQLTRMQQRKRAVANMLASQGLTEVINYPFTNQEMVDLLGFSGDRAKSFKIANPMSEEFPLLRTHLIPGLLTTLQRNLSRGAKDVAIFELGTVFRNTTVLADAVMPDLKKKPAAKVIDQIYAGVPKQMLFVGGVLVGEQIKSGWQGKGLPWSWQDGVAKAVEIVESTGNTYEIINTELAPWHPGRCAEIKVNGKAVAHAGELHPRVCNALNLPPRTVVFAVILSELPMPEHSYLPKIWNFPAVVQDVALVVDGNVAAISIKNALIEGGGELLESVELFDRYDQIGDGKVSLAFTLTFRSPDQTLTSEEVAKYRDQAVAVASKKYGAVLRG
jgi:phenylalanyl-tRNA synthetase beta chain